MCNNEIRLKGMCRPQLNPSKTKIKGQNFKEPVDKTKKLATVLIKGNIYLCLALSLRRANYCGGLIAT